LIVFLRQYFQSPDAFSFPQFLFCEEVFIGLNAQSHGLRCLELPGLSYAHANHGVIGSIPSRSAIKCLQRSHAWAAKALAEAESYEATR
jgi:hypothetical protein